MENYKEFAINFVKQAGEIMRQKFAMGMKKHMKVDHSPVTETDLAINKMLVEEIARRFPDHGVFGEEQSNLKEGGSEYIWICDPIDSTISFAHGIPIATSSLALTRKGQSILAAVYDPFCDRLYYAEKGKGASINNKPINVSKTAQLDGAEGAVEISGKSKFDILDLPKLLKSESKTNVVIFNAIVYTSMLVATGEFDFNVFPRTGAYDAAAAKIIIEEAGGKVTDLFGQEQAYDQPIKGFIATNGSIHQELIKAVRGVLKLRP